MRRSFILIMLSAWTACLPAPAGAASFSDPFGVGEELPVRPQAACQPFSPQDELTLVAAIDVALCNHPDTRAMWAQAKASAAGLGQARAAYLPTVEAGLSANYTKTDRANFLTPDRYGSYGPDATLSYLLFDFGGREAAVEAARQQMLEAGWAYSSAMQALVLQVIRDYMGVFTARESLKAAMESEVASKEAFEAAQARLDVGVATPADTAQAETAYAQSILDRERAENALQLTIGNFAALLHLPPQTELRLAPVEPEAMARPVDAEVEAFIHVALLHRPDLAASRAREERAKAALKQTRKLAYPSLSVDASTAGTSYTNGTETSRNDNVIGLRLSIPIFSGFSDTYGQLAAQGELEAATSSREGVEDAVALDVWSSYHNYRTAQRSYTTAQSVLKSAEASHVLAMGRYKEGKGTLLDALTAQAKLADAKRQWVEARYDALITRFDLLRAVGDEISLERMQDRAEKTATPPADDAGDVVMEEVMPETPPSISLPRELSLPAAPALD